MAAISKTCITHRKKEEKSRERQRALLQNLTNTAEKSIQNTKRDRKRQPVKMLL